jgi:hypothetical protein
MLGLLLMLLKNRARPRKANGHAPCEPRCMLVNETSSKHNQNIRLVMRILCKPFLQNPVAATSVRRRYTCRVS